MKVLYFAAIRQRLGTGEEILPLPDGVTTVSELAVHLAGRGPAYAAVFAAPKGLRAAVNQVHARFDAPVREGDEVAFFPPMTGG